MKMFVRIENKKKRSGEKILRFCKAELDTARNEAKPRM